MPVVTRVTLSTISIRFYITFVRLKLSNAIFLFVWQDSNMGKSSDEVTFALCFDDANKDEMERMQHMISEIESENGCYRLLITKLEDELLMIRKSETRAVSHSLTILFTAVDFLTLFRNKIVILNQINCAFYVTKSRQSEAKLWKNHVMTSKSQNCVIVKCQ